MKYIAAVAGTRLHGEPWKLTSSLAEYQSAEGARINYSGSRTAVTEIYIEPWGLLSETMIREQQVVIDPDDPQRRFFCNGSDMGFDVFSALFYLLSRYEEYLPWEPDMYGRFPHGQSLAFRNGFLHEPLADQWLLSLKDRLEAVFPQYQQLFRNCFLFCPTYDIDMAWSVRNRGLARTTGGLLRSFPGGLFNRLAVLTGRKDDPFDSFDWLHQLHQRHQLKPVYFFLLAARVGIYDKNNDPSQKPMRELVRSHAKLYPTGIHPSWRSGDEPARAAAEIATLQELTGNNVKLSRQHYIRFTLPGTFRELIRLGISDDYSMGYGSINGFRASASFPFPWYDLEAEEVTSLLLHPFCYMDANSLYEQGMDPDAALEEMKGYFVRVKAVQGHLLMIWHNHFLGTDPGFNGWKEVYGQFAGLVSEQ